MEKTEYIIRSIMPKKLQYSLFDKYGLIQEVAAPTLTAAIQYFKKQNLGKFKILVMDNGRKISQMDIQII